MTGTKQRLPSSFRDPSGYLYSYRGDLYRNVDLNYRKHYDCLMESGLYEKLVNLNLLISHEEVSLDGPEDSGTYKILRPTYIDYISYPYEWCFGQLKAAALATLRIQKIALEYGMTLKDASGFNIQFYQGSAMMIDTLSFEIYEENSPWVAYKQFCQHFFAPLVLITYCDYQLIKLLRVNIDGLPLGLTSKLLPLRTWLSYPILSHIHLHARAQDRYSDIGKEGQEAVSKKVTVSLLGLKAMLSGMHNAVNKLSWDIPDTEWGRYYEDTNYTDSAMTFKRDAVKRFLGQIDGSRNLAIDLGANDGTFSRIAIEMGYTIIAQDVDPVAVEANYRRAKEEKETRMLPLVQDLTNPSPALGWAHQERMSLAGRPEADVLLVLALIHHLAVSNNVPFDACARYLSRLTRFLIIEFVPKSDTQVQRLLATREDVFPLYNREEFEKQFGIFFERIESAEIENTQRILYLFKRR